MKSIILSLFISISLFAQGDVLLNILSDHNTFNPLTYDTNNKSVYDGDLELTTSAWGDQSGNNIDITLYNLPTINSATLNGHSTIAFNGTDEYGKSSAVLDDNTQPYTIYLVMKQISWVGDDAIMDDGGTTYRMFLRQETVSPNIRMTTDNSNFLASDPDLAIGEWGILTLVYNGTNSEIRTNLNVAVTGNAGSNNGDGGITLCSRAGPSLFGNIEFAYIIKRTGADNTATQNLFINWLKTRFGL